LVIGSDLEWGNSGIEVKRCSRCGETKDKTAFVKSARRYDGVSAYCKPCVVAYKRDWCRRDPARTSLMRRRNNLRFCFGLSLEEYAKMSLQQNGVCAICKQPEAIRNSSLSVDHNHVTGTNRGLLCRKCNAIVGYLEGPHGKSALAYIDTWGNN